MHDYLDTKLNAYNPLSVKTAVVNGHLVVVLETLDSRVHASGVTRLDLCRENDGMLDERPQILSKTMICSECV